MCVAHFEWGVTLVFVVKITQSTMMTNVLLKKCGTLQITSLVTTHVHATQSSVIFYKPHIRVVVIEVITGGHILGGVPASNGIDADLAFYARVVVDCLGDVGNGAPDLDP